MGGCGPTALVQNALEDCAGLAPEKPQETLSRAKFSLASLTRCHGRRSQEVPSDCAIPGEGHRQGRCRNQTPTILGTMGIELPGEWGNCRPVHRAGR